MATKIVIDAGHGGSDPGAVYMGRLEKDDNLALALAVGDILSDLGYDVEYTRTEDVYDSPVQKARKGNESGADYFVSIHRNSSPNSNQYNGVQTLLYNDSGIKADMARNINSELEKVGFRNINVVERPNLAVLKRTTMPALLVEAGFINSDVDNTIFDDNFDAMAQAIANGIDMTLNGSVDVFAEGNNYASKDLDDLFDDERDDDNDFDDFFDDDDDDGKWGYQILVGIYRGYAQASYQLNRVKNDGYDGNIYEDDGLYQVRIGNYNSVEDALKVQKELRAKGYSTLIVNSF